MEMVLNLKFYYFLSYIPKIKKFPKILWRKSEIFRFVVTFSSRSAAILMLNTKKKLEFWLESLFCMKLFLIILLFI